MTTDFLREYYENYFEDERLSSRWGQVEFLTTMRYIERYIKNGMKILDVGAGTGRYSHAIAKMGFYVDAVELIQHNVDVFRSKIEGNDNVTIRQGNALDLSFIDSDTYDITLLMGPMYHLYTKEDKIKALSEAIRVTKQNGILFIAYCVAEGAIIEYGFKEGNIFSLIEKNLLDSETFETFSAPEAIFEMARKKDIDELMSGFETERLHYAATDGFSRFMRETLETMDDDVYKVFLKYHFTICENEDVVGVTHHSLDVVRKK